MSEFPGSDVCPTFNFSLALYNVAFRPRRYFHIRLRVEFVRGRTIDFDETFRHISRNVEYALHNESYQAIFIKIR